jgi:flagellar basal-body rod modification protein FlgD
MDFLQMSPVTTAGQTAAAKVATALSSKQTNAKPADSTTNDGSASDATDPSTITSSDFLTLLVSELKNQDPTQPTDPNAYIQQLVGVNSLQQLISINQGLTSIETGATTGATTSS